MNCMLASVRNLKEARVVLNAGVDWIDIKEPAAGALGAPSLPVVQAIVNEVSAERPVSATLGDHWREFSALPENAVALAQCGVDHVKFALDADCFPAAKAAIEQTVAAGVSLLAVCKAEVPLSADRIVEIAASGIRGIMLDTADKSGPGLRGLYTQDALAEFVDVARPAGLLVGLAGQLRLEDIAPLATLGADYLGFRSALCRAHERVTEIDPVLVNEVLAHLRSADAAPEQNKYRNEVA